jgi:hypothetical protein
MGLPAGQQRVLDRMEDALRLSEPRLAAMYAMFGKLTKNEAWPLREQLPAVSGRQSWPAKLRSITFPGRVLAGLIGRRGAHRARRPAGRRPLGRALLLGHMVAVLAVLGLLVGLSGPGTHRACPGLAAMRTVALHLRSSACTAPAGAQRDVSEVGNTG